MHSDIRSETLINIHKHLHRRTLRTWSIGLQSRSIIRGDGNKSSLAASEIYYLRRPRGVVSACFEKKEKKREMQRAAGAARAHGGESRPVLSLLDEELPFCARRGDRRRRRKGMMILT